MGEHKGVWSWKLPFTVLKGQNVEIITSKRGDLLPPLHLNSESVSSCQTSVSLSSSFPPLQLLPSVSFALCSPPLLPTPIWSLE